MAIVGTKMLDGLKGLKASPLDNLNCFLDLWTSVSQLQPSPVVSRWVTGTRLIPVHNEIGDRKMMEIKIPMRVSELLKTTVENRQGEKLGTIQDLMVGVNGLPKIRHPVSRRFPGNG